MSERHSRIVPILALATAGSLWGTGFFFGKIALIEMPVGTIVRHGGCACCSSHRPDGDCWLSRRHSCSARSRQFHPSGQSAEGAVRLRSIRRIANVRAFRDCPPVRQQFRPQFSLRAAVYTIEAGAYLRFLGHSPDIDLEKLQLSRRHARCSLSLRTVPPNAREQFRSGSHVAH